MDVSGMDVSWMAHGAPKDKSCKQPPLTRTTSSTSGHAPDGAPARAVPAHGPTSTAASSAPANNQQPAIATAAQAPEFEASPPPPVSTRRITFGKNGAPNNAPVGQPPTSRRNSWIQSMTSKFGSSSPHQHQQHQQQHPADPQPKQAKGANGGDAPPPKPAQNKTPADADAHSSPPPARSSQPGVLGGLLRRFSTSGGMLGSGLRGNHGIVERRTLNVDRRRERCPISELPDARLRKVAFCVDVEVAPQPRYDGDERPASQAPPATAPPSEKLKKRKMGKGEAAALKDPKALEAQKEADGVVESTGEPLPREPATNAPPEESSANPSGNRDGPASADSGAKKREKKKRSEEERKARKEKRRRQAEASGSIPMEIHGDDSSDSSRPGTPVGSSKTAASTAAAPPPPQFSTSNPVRIYRRCCQLRESHILKKITEQLSDPANVSAETGLVGKLDLTGYWLQLDDLRTLGDWLAVVAVRELVLDGCGVTDEGLRCVLSGLLATKRPEPGRRRITSSTRRARPLPGGMVERLVLRNNDIGIDGWKHICLFVNMCRSVKSLDLSGLAFPRPPSPALALAQLLSRSLGERLAGPNLELLNLGDTRPATEQLGVILDGALKSGVRRLGLANNELDAKAVEHVAAFLLGGKCEGLDLSGNELGGNLGTIAAALARDRRHPLWALSLADCGLAASDVGALLPVLAPLGCFRFLDLSHNQDLCQTEPGLIPLLRKYLPKIPGFKRVHLANVGMTIEQAVCLVEVLPDIAELSCIKLSENAALVKLADAQTAQDQEEACALYASLLTATRLSRSIVLVDIEVPSERSSDVVKAMAKQVVAYCLRNMELLPVAQGTTTAPTTTTTTTTMMTQQNEPRIPNVMYDLVDLDEGDEGQEPDDGYMIGGTGVAKALHCFLNNNNNNNNNSAAAESRRPSGEFARSDQDDNNDDDDKNNTNNANNANANTNTNAPKSPRPVPSRIVPPAKAKELSKQLLASARKIRTRIQPTLAKLSQDPDADEHHYRRLVFLDQTLQSIIRRFEDEFPETRLPPAPSSPSVLFFGSVAATTASTPGPQDTHPDNNPTEPAPSPSDDEDTAPATLPEDNNDVGVAPLRPLSRTNSSLSQTSRAHVEEEGRAHRAGHRLRQGIIKLGPEHYDVLLGGNTEDDNESPAAKNPLFVGMLEDMLEELGLGALVVGKGAVRAFREHREEISERMRDVDPDHWRLFAESQEKARVNAQVGSEAEGNRTT